MAPAFGPSLHQVAFDPSISDTGHLVAEVAQARHRT